MFKNDIHFCETLNTNVEVYTKTGRYVGKGELRLSENNLPNVRFSYDTNLKAFSQNTYFTCKSDSAEYTLLDCNVSEYYIYIGFLIKGKKHSGKFKKLDILLSGMSSWLNNSRSAKINESTVTKNTENKTFSVTVTDQKNRTFNVSNRNSLWVSNKRAETVIKEYSLIRLTLLDGHFSTDDVIYKVNEIRGIFSLLLGSDLSIEYVRNIKGNHSKNSLYFATNSKKQDQDAILNRCFSHSYYMYEGDKWDHIFKNFFEKKYSTFKDVWLKFSSMLSYNGTWEYEIFSHISLLDQYTLRLAKEKTQRLSQSKFKEIKRSLKDTLDNLDIKETNFSVVKNIGKQITHLSNADITLFKDRFDFSLSSVDQRVLQVIDLKQDDFSHMKKLRDQIAHGDIITTKDKIDLTHEYILLNKIKLLLLYWVYKDFGFSDYNYLEIVDKTRNIDIVLNAKINRNVLDKAVSKYAEIQVTQADFRKAKKQNFRGVVLGYNSQKNKYSFDNKLSEKGYVWCTSTKYKHKSFERCIADYNVSSDVANITYVNTVLLKCKGMEKLVWGICILNCSDKIQNACSINRTIKIHDKV